VLQLLLTPRWLAATVLAVLAAGTAFALGAWQWDQAQVSAQAVAERPEDRPVPIGEVLAAHPDGVLPSGILVRATGSYGTDALTADATGVDGGAEMWAVAPIDLDGGAGTFAMVRGLAEPEPSAPRTDPVVVTARVQPPAADPTAGTLTAAELTERGWDPRGYLVLTDQQPVDAEPAEPVSSPLPPPPEPGLRWQNAFYAVQWSLFGVFFGYLWVRFFREDLRAARAGASAADDVTSDGDPARL
jgi:hypothetical protein